LGASVCCNVEGFSLYSPHTDRLGQLFILYNDRTMAKKLAYSPLGDRVLVKPEGKGGEKRLASGIIIPESVDKEKLMTGEVVAVGPGKHGETGSRTPMDVSVGDTILFKKPWDEPLKIDDEEYYVLGESDISLIKR